MAEQQIELGLAISLAGQVSAGLTPGEGQEERAVASLMVIGLMVKNAAKNKLVDDTLALVDRSRVTEHGGGVTRFEVVGDG